MAVGPPYDGIEVGPSSRLPSLFQTTVPLVRPLIADYLVVGGGATALNFVDVLLDETAAESIIVDRRERIGGHWNDAYPFVRLHQPSARYGVPTRAIRNAEDDAVATDARGASAHVVRTYFEQLLRERLLPSRRVSWRPSSEYRRRDDGAHVIRSLLTGKARTVTARRRVVDATLTQTEIPAAIRRRIGSRRKCRSFRPTRSMRSQTMTALLLNVPSW